MLLRTNSQHPDFIQLVRLLDTELAKRDGDEHDFYHQFNKIDHIQHALIAYHDGQPVACGAMKPFATDAMEIKRMFTLPPYRGQGFARQVLAALEAWATEIHISRCVLETGKRQPEAIRLYEKVGYRQISNYGQYAGIENSVCFEKLINK